MVMCQVFHRRIKPMQSYSTFKDEQYDKLAEHVRKYVDIPRLYQILSDD